jgi:cytochrome c oxidase subunit 2
MITQLKYKLLSFFFCFSDAAEPWQLGLQDPATPVVEGMIFFHDYLMFFLIVIGFFVMWMLYKILKNFDENTNFSSINFTHSSPLEFIWTAKMVDVILLTSIFLFSLFFYFVTLILKIKTNIV